MSTAIVDVSVPSQMACDEVAVYVRPAGDAAHSWARHGVYRAGRIDLDNLPSTGKIQVAIAPRVGGIEADEGRWTVLDWNTADATALPVPDAVTNFGVGQDGANLRFTWSPVAVAGLSHYELRRGASWDTALWIADIAAPATEYTVGWWASGSQTYLLRAVTRRGVRATTDATVIITVAADPYEVVQTTTTEGPTFGGTKTGTEVSSSVLQPTTHPASYASASGTYSTYTDPWWFPCARYGTYVTPWVDAGAVQNQKVELSLSHTVDVLSTAYSDVFAPIDPEVDDVTGAALGPGDRRPLTRGTLSGYPVDGVRLLVEIDTAQDATPTAEGYRVWVPGTRYRCRQYRLRVTFLNDWPYARPKISTLTHKRLLRNLKDETVATVSGTGGTAASFTAPFTTAPRVTATVIGTTAVFATVDSVTTTGCNVRVWLHDGVEQSSGTVHINAAGV